MSIIHLLESKYVLAPAAAVATIALFFVIRRLTESPEKKKARKLLAQVIQADLNIVYMQDEYEGRPSGYDEANRLLHESHEPERQAQLAFKERRYLDAQRHAEEALRLIESARKAQSDHEPETPLPDFPGIPVLVIVLPRRKPDVDSN